MIDYRTVKLKLDSINTVLRSENDSTGTFTVPYTDISNGEKHIIFFGTNHTRDVSHPQFSQLRKAFINMKPEIAFNEGGQIREDKHYASLDSGILADGETGYLKVLCDSLNIKMMNGDMNTDEEFSQLLKTIPKDQVYLYMAIERYLSLYKAKLYPNLTLEEAFKEQFISYLDKYKFGLTDEERSFSYLEQVYKKYLKRDLSIDSLIEIQEYYLLDDGLFGDIGRATKVVRDKALLNKIDKALETHNKVFVVFGGSHRIALEPALRELMEKKGAVK